MALFPSLKAVRNVFLTPFDCVGLVTLQVINSLFARDETPPPLPPLIPVTVSPPAPPPTGFLLGTAATTGEPICATTEDLKRHMYLLGATGTGKTTMIIRLFDAEVAKWP